jgi:outer membrane protein OmpA-like peptidoglycan-associated protein
MKSACCNVVWTMSLLSVSAAALAAPEAAAKQTPPQEPAGFIAGGVIGGLAAGPIGAVLGAGIGTWLGSRVHRAGEATQAEAKVAALQAEKSTLQSEKTDLAETNRALTARLDQLSHSVDAVEGNASKVLDGLQGDVLFRTGSAEISPEMAQGISGLAAAVAKSPALKVRVDGYADARGGVDANLKLSAARADAVRDLFLAAGVSESALEINAYGKNMSVADDYDGYALERRVRLTLEADGPAAVAKTQ